MDACVNCGAEIVWMVTMNAWIHQDTGLAACRTHRRQGCLTIFAGREVLAAPTRQSPLRRLRRRFDG